MKFSLKKQILVAYSYDETNYLMKVAVLDNGRGIKKEEMNKLFHAFEKLERTADVNSEGIGIGLVICKRLVEANYGKIEIHSDGDTKGTTVRFSMHMALPTEQEIEETKELKGNFGDENDIF